MKKYLFFIILLFPMLSYTQGIKNTGGVIKISTGALLNINGSGYTNESNITNTAHGAIENDGTISLAGNWLNNATLAINKVFINLNNQGEVIVNGGNTQIGGANTTNFENLTINKTLASNIVQLNNTITVGNGTQGVLSLTQGILSLSSNRVIINNSATTALVYTSNSYVVSETYNNGSGIVSATPYNTCTSIIQWNIGEANGSYIFPFATASGTSVAFIYNNTGGAGTGTAGNVSVSTYHTNNLNYPYPTDGTNPVLHMAGYFVADNSENAIDRFHIVNVLNYTTKPTATLTFYYDPTNDLNGIDPLLIQAQRWVRVDATNGYWANPPVGSLGTNPISGISTDNSIDCNIWVGSNSETPLPIELIGFDGKCNGNETMLYWTTATETNNDYFTIEKSIDTKNWNALTTINGAGNSNALINYTTYDYSPSIGVADYYRLKQTDYDGKYTYSDIISVKCNDNSNEFSIINIYQQQNRLVFNCSNSDGLPYNIDLFDITGRKMISTKYTPTNIGYNQTKLDITDLTIGCYMVVLHNQTNTLSQKVIISKY